MAEGYEFADQESDPGSHLKAWELRRKLLAWMSSLRETVAR